MSELFTMMQDYVTPNSTVIDIGANVGNVSRAFAELVGQVIAFEPQPDVFRLLQSSVPENVRAEKLAVGAQNGDVSFFLDKRAGMKGVASSQMILEDLEAMNLIEEIQVRCVTLDHYVQSHDLAPDFIKIDVEGCEPDVFVGGWNTIEEYRPTMFFEFWENHISRYEEWFRRLSAIYKLTRVPGGEEVTEYYRANQGEGNIDILCRRK